MIKHCLGISEINSIPGKLKKFSTLKNSPCPLTQSTKVHRRALREVSLGWELTYVPSCLEQGLS